MEDVAGGMGGIQVLLSAMDEEFINLWRGMVCAKLSCLNSKTLNLTSRRSRAA